MKKISFYGSSNFTVFLVRVLESGSADGDGDSELGQDRVKCRLDIGGSVDYGI